MRQFKFRRWQMSGSRSCQLTFATFALGISMLAAPSQAAEDDAFRGRNINLIVSTDAGTGYDIYARTIARHWPRHIPGAPTITVQNMAGAGGLRAANLLFNVSPKDSLTLGLVHQSTVSYEPFFGNKQAIFDPRKFNWLGTPGQETSTVIVWHTVPVRSIQDEKSAASRSQRQAGHSHRRSTHGDHGLLVFPSI